MELLRSNGAFSTAFQRYRRENENFQRRMSPPKRFVATQLSGGVKALYKRLRNKEKPPHHRHVPWAQTDQDGKFQPCYPVPLLAGRYKFMQVLGQGQSSILIAVQDTFHPDKRPVAVKVMNLNNSYLGAQVLNITITGIYCRIKRDPVTKWSHSFVLQEKLHAQCYYSIFPL